MCRGLKVLFLDESGDHNLVAIDDNYPVFVLGGVIVDADYARGPLTEAINQFKYELFGRTDLVLHTADIVRNRNGFEKLRNVDFRTHFYNELNSLLRNLRYEVVACAFHKRSYRERYGVNAISPYSLGLTVMVEVFCDAARPDADGGTVIIEKRGEPLDRDVEESWRMLRANGSRYAEAAMIRSTIAALELRDKKENLAGLQLADLVTSPIGRHILGKPDKEDWQIVQEKFRRGPDDQTDEYGLFKFPKE